MQRKAKLGEKAQHTRKTANRIRTQAAASGAAKGLGYCCLKVGMNGDGKGIITYFSPKLNPMIEKHPIGRLIPEQRTVIFIWRAIGEKRSQRTTVRKVKSKKTPAPVPLSHSDTTENLVI
ncbi:MAG: hypothetical protein L0Y39_09130 [Methylococcaceae bacterium]|nr:hypothetical protein [Methylococcaceae bacterium]